MKADIVARLRGEIAWEPEVGELMTEAADEVELLRLTDAEREAIEMAADDNRYHQDPGGRAAHIEMTLRGLLERTK